MNYSIDLLDSLEGYREAKEHWIRKLCPLTKCIIYPPDYSNANAEMKSEVQFFLDKELGMNIWKACKEQDILLYSYLLTVYKILLYKTTFEQEITVGTPTFQVTQETEEVPYTIVSDIVSGDDTFGTCLKRVNETVKESINHQHYPVDQISSSLLMLPVNTFLSNIFILENIQSTDAINSCIQSTNNKMTLIFQREEDAIRGCITYDNAMYRIYTIKELINRFTLILQQVANNPNIQIKDICLMEKKEYNHTVNIFNQTNAVYPRTKTIHQLIEAQVKASPSAIALQRGDRQLSYKQLNEMANQMARKLKQNHVLKGDRVGLLADHSIETVIAILAILKVGASYVPIDPSYPWERIRYILENSAVQIILTDRSLKELNLMQNAINIKHENLFRGDRRNVRTEMSPDDEAYMIFTSGSTGNPKGVMISHRGVVNYLYWAKKMYVGKGEATFPLFSSISFDLTVTSLFTPLITGNKVVVYPKEHEEELISKIIYDDLSDVMKLTPAHLRLLLLIPYRSSRLKRLIVGGEALTSELAYKVSEHYDHRIVIFNEYGPTETSVGCMIHQFDSSKNYGNGVPIGTPADNVQIYILDQYMYPCPVGVTGEIYIGGAGVGKGYWGNAELTSEKFIDNPFQLKSKLYKTGDLAKHDDEGEILFVGRIDELVKIRGYRIEIAEVEANLMKQEAVIEASVIVKGSDDDRSLWAYIVVNRQIDTDSIKRELAVNLPEYMIPSKIVIVDQIPKTINGKIDRKSLHLFEEDVKQEYVAPRNSVEETLVEIWQEVLGVPIIGVMDSFFDHGGHSIKAITILARVKQRFEVQIPIGQLFRSPTIADLADMVRETAKSKWLSITPTEKMPFYPVSSVQKRLFFMNKFEGVGTAFNMSIILTFKGNLSVERLSYAMMELVNRHESFRTSFEWMAGELVQIVHEHVEFQVEYEIVDEDQVKTSISNFIVPFELNKAPLLRVKVLEIAPEVHVLMVDMHHIISDGVSKNILQEEFIKLYRGEPLEQLRIQYKDVAVWQRAYQESDYFKEHETYWLNQFVEEAPILDIPTDFPRPAIQSFVGDKVEFVIDTKLMSKIKQMSNKLGVTIYMTLLAAYNVLLSKYSGQEDFVVGSTITGRNHADVEKIIGAFINILPLRNHLSMHQTFQSFLTSVKENTLQAYEHQDYPYEELVERLNVRRDMSRNPLFDTMFIFHSHLQPDDRVVPAFEGLEIIPNPYWEYEVSKYDLTLVASQKSDTMLLTLEFCTNLYTIDTVQQMVEHYLNILKCVTEQPMIRLADIEIMSDEEQTGVSKFHNKEYEISLDKTIHKLIEDQVQCTPDKIAVECDGVTLTYRELDEHANRLARYLIKKQVGNEDRIGILLDRSVYLLICIIGVLKAGATYVPIDPGYPEGRIDYVLKDSDMKYLLLDKRREQKHFDTVQCIDISLPEISQESPENVETTISPNQLAYIIYTSGSTGTPKGVMIEHRSLLHLFKGITERIDFNPDKSILATTSIAFDISVIELLLPVTMGMRVIIANDRKALLPSEIVKLMRENRIDMIQFTPAKMKMILDHSNDLSFLRNVKDILLGGEALSKNIYNELVRRTDARVFNMYGPTETTVWSSLQEVNSEHPITLGEPLLNTRFYVLDPNMKIQPFGVIGELYISGDGLARGYWSKPDLTNERFLEAPFLPSKRLYKTGDYVRRMRDGTIHFMGRTDDQVKLGGYRIELSEIENYFLQHESVLNAVVMIRTDAEDVKSLCAYIICRTELDTISFRQYLLNGLPHYMIPTQIVQMEEFPLTVNGKIDRGKFPEPISSNNAGIYVAPTTDTEEKLEKIWGEILKVDRVSIKDSFFDIGGNSILAVMLDIEMEKAQITTQDVLVYKYNTIEEMAAHIDGSSNLNQS